MEIGVTLDPEWPAETIIRRAVLAAELGYDRIWIGEHPLSHDPFQLLLCVAQQAPGAHVGISTTNASARHPGILAASSASLVTLAECDFALGIGASSLWQLAPLGLGLEHQVARCREAVLIVRTLLENGTSTADGVVFKTAEARLSQLKAAVDVPLLMGVSGGPKMIDMAGEVADGIIVVGGTHSFYRSIIERFQASVVRNGRPPGQLVVNGNVMVGPRKEVDARAREVARHTIRHRADAQPHSLAQLGITPEQAEVWGRDGSQIPDAVLQELVITGSAEECAAALGQLAAIGVTQYVMRMPDEAEIQLIGEELLPILHRAPSATR
jgi:5,10-methylenetetrahydromethanopterin reductase